MKMKSLLTAVLAFGLGSFAQAGETGLQPSELAKFMKSPTASLKVSAGGVKVVGARPFCDPPGAACYAEDSWTCCSGICIDQLCH